MTRQKGGKKQESLKKKQETTLKKEQQDDHTPIYFVNLMVGTLCGTLVMLYVFAYSPDVWVRWAEAVAKDTTSVAPSLPLVLLKQCGLENSLRLAHEVGTKSFVGPFPVKMWAWMSTDALLTGMLWGVGYLFIRRFFNSDNKNYHTFAKDAWYGSVAAAWVSFTKSATMKLLDHYSQS